MSQKVLFVSLIDNKWKILLSIIMFYSFKSITLMTSSTNKTKENMYNVLKL